MEDEIYTACEILTIGQRCADWFVLRKFRITRNNAGMVMLSGEEVFSAVELGEHSGKEKTRNSGSIFVLKKWGFPQKDQ